MKKPWNLVNVPVYSIATMHEKSVNMNICTYVSAVSMKPKRYMVAIYHHTKTHEIASKYGVFVLQLLSDIQHGLIKNFGQKSGIEVDKHAFLMRKNKPNSPNNAYSVFEWEDHLVLKNCVAILKMKTIQIIPAGDHDMFLCDVVAYKNLNDAPILDLNVLRSKKLIRI